MMVSSSGDIYAWRVGPDYQCHRWMNLGSTSLRKWPMPRNRALAWTQKKPIKEGWYGYRADDRSAVLQIFDPLGNGFWEHETGRKDG